LQAFPTTPLDLLLTVCSSYLFTGKGHREDELDHGGEAGLADAHRFRIHRLFHERPKWGRHLFRRNREEHIYSK